MLYSNQFPETVCQFANAIRCAGLRVPVKFALDVIDPISFLGSQVALFVTPFARGHAWERYVVVLTDETNWHELRRFLEE